jgi:hypothetical protein
MLIARCDPKVITLPPKTVTSLLELFAQNVCGSIELVLSEHNSAGDALEQWYSA